MELKGTEFLGLLDEAAAALNKAQSYLLCSLDELALMLLARRLVEADGGRFNSVDISILPEGEKIVVSDIDILTENAAITPVELKYKYYILKNAETMNDAASNKLLKTLEEPPSVTKIILLSGSERAVLPTIRSRCRVINLPLFPQDKIDKIADSVYADSPLLDKAKALSQGSITRFIRAVGGEYETAESLVFDTLLNMKSSRDEARCAARLAKNKDEIPQAVDMFEMIFADTARYHGGLALRLYHRRSDIAAIAAFYSVDTVIRLGEAFDKIRKRLKFFGNASSMVDEFLFSLLETRQKCQS